MTAIAIISSSELSRENRMDPGFFVALDTVRARVAELRASVTEEDAFRWLSAIAIEDKAPLLVLGRGQQPRLTADTIKRIERDYPHMALAILQRNLAPAVERLQRLRKRLAADEAALAALLTVGEAPAPRFFEAGHIYPLKDPEQFDDDFGTGFDHVLIPHDADPGRSWVHDAWIVNRHGERHPGIDCCPVPVRLDDVEISQGAPSPGCED